VDEHPFASNDAHRFALITGASSGIGRVLAENFAEHGYDVILSARSAAKMEAHAADLQNRFGITALVIAADLESPTGTTELHAEIKRRGITVSALVNNAGYGTFGLFENTSLESQLGMMQLNMTSLVALARLFLSDLIATKGKMLNTASTAAFQPGPYMAVYYATKAFVLSFSEALAAELADTGVTVTAFCPGPTASGFQDKAAMHHSGMVKGKRLPTAEEVARKGFRAFERGRRVYIPGWKNWILAQLPRISPRRLVTAVVTWVTGPTE
jgi:short-subunit dehydrogenase